MNRKELKTAAKQTLKTHYMSLMMIDFIVALLGVTITASSVYVSGKTITTMVNGGVSVGWMLLAFAMIALLICVVIGVTEVVSARMFLESKEYEKVPLSHALRPLASGKWGHIALAMGRTYLFLFLWALTIVGGFIMAYAYAMVPYLLAENPDLTGKEAIQLSKEMMIDHKWELFVVDLSMIGWALLGVITCGFGLVFYVKPYYSAIRMHYFTNLRGAVKEAEPEKYAVCNDTYLYEHATEEELSHAYKDIKMDELYLKDNPSEYTGAKKFFADTLALSIGSEKSCQTHQALESIRKQSEEDHAILDGKIYPERLSPQFVRKNKHMSGQLDADRSYSLGSLIVIFVLCAVLSFIVYSINTIFYDEVVLDFGFMKGPWFPMVGSIVILSIVLLKKLRHNPLATYIGCFVLTGLVMFGTHYIFEAVYGIRLWECVNEVFVLGGRVGVLAMLCIAGFSTLAIYVIGPLVDNALNKVAPNVVTIVAAVLVVLLAVDSMITLSHPDMERAQKVENYYSELQEKLESEKAIPF